MSRTKVLISADAVGTRLISSPSSPEPALTWSHAWSPSLRAVTEPSAAAPGAAATAPCSSRANRQGVPSSPGSWALACSGCLADAS